MMKPETLREYRRVVNKFDHRATTERERQLIDSHLEAYAQIDRLEDRIGELEDRIGELEDRIGELEDEVATAEARAEELEGGA